MPGPGPVVILPPLATWAQQRITAILQSTTSEALEAALSNFLTRNANITVNGVHLSRDQWIKQLRNTEALEESASVSYNGSVEVPANKSEPTKAGVVGLFFDATIFKTIRIRDAPAESKVTSSINMIVVQDKNLQPPPGPFPGFFDRRRVSTLNQVYTDAAQPFVVVPSEQPADSTEDA